MSQVTDVMIAMIGMMAMIVKMELNVLIMMITVVIRIFSTECWCPQSKFEKVIIVWHFNSQPGLCVQWYKKTS